MQFTLRSRFRGAFLGAALGEVFGTIALQSGILAQSSLSLRDAAQIWRSNPSPEADSLAGRKSRSRPMIDLANELIQPAGQLQVLQSSSPTEQDCFAQKPSSAIDFLPLILFCHENQTQMQQSLVPRSAHLPPHQQTELHAIALIVSRILQEQLGIDRSSVGTFFHSPSEERRTEDLRSGNPLIPLVPGTAAQDSSLSDQLQQVQSWLEQGIPLTMRSNPVPSDSVPSDIIDTKPLKISSPVVAALYGMLKTPNFPLALLHTLRLNPDPEAAALVGLFAGTHLSEAGLPIGWRLAIDHYQSSTLKQLWGIESIAALLELSDRLWAAWSGAFQPHNWQSAKSTVTAIPHLVRPR